MMPQTARPVYRFGPFRLDAAECRLFRGEAIVDLSPRLVDVLRLLVARPGELVTKEHLLSTVWPDVIVTENGVGFCDFARMKRRGNSFEDLATFLASVEALEKYPFCNRSITGQIQENFLNAYNISQTDAAILRVFKMKALLGMFAQGRTVKESAVRKKVMWANVMKKFIHQAAQRSMSPVAAA